GAGVFEHFFGRLDLDEELRDFGLDAAITAHIDFPARIHGDHADVLDAGFGAVTRAAGDRELDLVRAPHAGKVFFEGDAHGGGVLGAESAELAADAGFDGAQAFAIGMAAG